VLPQKRFFIAAAGTLTATLALAGCGSNNYGLSSAESNKLAAPPAADQAVAGAGLSDVNGDDDTAADGDATTDDDAASDADSDADSNSDAGKDDSTTPAVKPVGDVTDRLIAKTVPKMGNVVTDAKGWVLYRFDKDTADPAKSNCVKDCATLWPPLLADETLELSGISASKVSTIKRADGGRQITINGWPVYRYIGDKVPGKWSGQNVGGTWFVIDKNGKKNLTCLPKISKPVALPASAKKAEKTDSDSDDATDSSYSGGY
jgi:predicted lipoprotein with Yx(FWY)xxD motif